ncbi:MAG: ABC transporter ATP-binding protein [Burkholderiaceae bacterium]
MASAASVLRVDSISLAFGGVRVFDDISLNVAAGELVALIGPNGAGKTSVLNCVSGIYRPDAGAVWLDGQRIDGWRPNRIAAHGVARTFQHAELLPDMSVLENLLVGRHASYRVPLWQQCIFGRVARAQEREHRAAVERVIEFVELEGVRNAPVGGLAFGRQKVVGFARALAMNPALILLDEPSAGLNREEKEDLARFILRIRHELRIPMLWVEHDMQMVADLADRICALNYGHMITEGRPEQVLSHPAVIQAYLGDPAR